MKHLNSCRYRVIPDRIRRGHLSLLLRHCKGRGAAARRLPEHLSAVLPVLEEMGCSMQIEKESILLRCDKPLRAVSSISTMPYPGFPTDALAPVMAGGLHGAGHHHFYREYLSGPL